MTDFKAIYTHQAEQYDQMVAHEDYQGHIKRALQRIRPFPWPLTIELGAGTGRLTRLLEPHVQQIVALDIAAPMLQVARRNLTAKTDLCVADNRQLPLASGIGGVALAGWSLAHSVGWYPNSWQVEIEQALSEIRRLLQPGGTIIILETLGTGQQQPQPPTPGLATFYKWLEMTQNFQPMWIRTDYQFASVAEADRMTRFFFGDELAERIQREQLTVLPECTGIWWTSV